MSSSESSIPVGAEERITACYPDGARERVECWLDGLRVGERVFDQQGQLEKETPLCDGLVHGNVLYFDEGDLASMEPYENGLPHGTAVQWGAGGEIIGTYDMDRGTGIDLWRDERCGKVVLVEALQLRGGVRHGFDLWINEDQASVHEERFWKDGNAHGIERQWYTGALDPGYPRFFVEGTEVSQAEYARSRAQHPDLVEYREVDDLPWRRFPPEILNQLAIPWIMNLRVTFVRGGQRSPGTLRLGKAYTVDDLEARCTVAAEGLDPWPMVVSGNDELQALLLAIRWLRGQLEGFVTRGGRILDVPPEGEEEGELPIGLYFGSLGALPTPPLPHG